MISSILSTDSDFYLASYLDSNEESSLYSLLIQEGPNKLPALDKSRRLYHVNQLINIHCLCISPFMAPDLLAVTYGESHPGFSHYYKIITYSHFIYGLTKLVHSFICHCPQYLAFETRDHPLYRSLQPIDSPPVLFFILTFDFVLTLSLLKNMFNAIMSVTYKFSKRVTLVEGADT